MKKWLILTTLILSLLTFSTSAMSATISAGSYSVLPGQTFTIDITMAGIVSEVIEDFNFDLVINPNDSLLIPATPLNATAGSAVPVPANFTAFVSAANTITALYNAPFVQFPPDVTNGLLSQFDLTVSGAATIGDSWTLDFANLAFGAGGVAVDPAVTGISGSVNIVPIPPTVLLLGAGLVGLVGIRRRVKS